MKIDVSKFGEILISRPSGREAFLASRAYLVPTDSKDVIELDFSKVKVLAPSWIDEFLRGLKYELGRQVVCLPSENSSVIESLKILSEP